VAFFLISFKTGVVLNLAGDGSVRRRDFIKVVAGSAAAWPLAARVQQPEQMRRIGILMNRSESDPEGQARLAAFRQGLEQLGWNEGRNMRTDIRWGEEKIDLERKYATELVALAPDVVLASGTMSVAALQALSRTLPIVFAALGDPVGAGFVESLAHPGGNATGFMLYEYSFGGKLLELLKEIAPGVTRVAVLRNPTNPSQLATFGAVRGAAQVLVVEVAPIDTRDAGQIERGVTAFARSPNGGLIIMPGASASVHGALVVALAARYKLPAIYPFRYHATGGGLISYGPDFVEPFRPAAGYVDRILKGEKPADLPVQAATKYELVINLKTAKTLGLNVPNTLIGRADEVVE
jgi:putative tryptophan/tyrosine transport system substrate-binding protein